MRLFRYSFWFVCVAIAFQWAVQPVAAQHKKIDPAFRGNWTWDFYLTDKDLQNPDTVEIYRNLAYGQDMKTVPFRSLTVSLWQENGKLSGYCQSVEHFGGKMDDGHFTAIPIGNVAQFELQSSAGSIVKVCLTHRKNRLVWNIIRIDKRSEDFRLPMKVVLHKDFFPSVKGISLDSSLNEVRKALGKPIAINQSPHDVCGESLELKYEGLEAHFCKDEPKPFVWFLSITGKQWRMSAGLRTGITDLEVERILGIPDTRSIDEETGQEILSYHFTGSDSFVMIYLSKYKVVKIEMVADQT